MPVKQKLKDKIHVLTYWEADACMCLQVWQHLLAHIQCYGNRLRNFIQNMGARRIFSRGANGELRPKRPKRSVVLPEGL